MPTTKNYQKKMLPCIYLGEIVGQELCKVCGKKEQHIDLHRCNLLGGNCTKDVLSKNCDTKCCLRCDKKETDTTMVATYTCDMAKSELSAEQMAEIITQAPPGPWPNGWAGWDNVRQAHVQLLNQYLTDIPAYPEGKYKGRGIVVSVNAKPGWSSGKNLDHGYLPGAYVLVKELRRHGCTLPVTFAHLGPLEWDAHLTRLVEPLDVSVLDLHECNEQDPMRILAGWESKVYAIAQAPYEEVLYLDADNIPLKDPTFLFDSLQYKHYGAIFWPDVPPYDRAEWLPEAVWLNMGLPVGDTQAAESGQLLINKRTCWRELNVAKWLNEHSDYVYNWLFGDKDTFIMGWHKVAHDEGVAGMLRYHMVQRMPGGNHGSLVQRWIDNQPLFQHGTRNKPNLHGYPHADAVYPRKECEGHLAELKANWHGRLWWNNNPSEREQHIINDLLGTTFTYERKGLGKRPVRLLEDNRIGKGLAQRETDWNLFIDKKGPILVIAGIDGIPTCTFRPTNGSLDNWQGKWLQYERCDTTLSKEIV